MPLRLLPGRSCRALLAAGVRTLGCVVVGAAAHAALPEYDAAIQDSADGGLRPLARLSAPVQLSGAAGIPFNFGPVAGDATFEFILHGDPGANVSAYLAVGANAVSNLRYELWNNTGQLGFTQLGVADYTFHPAVASPTKAAHVSYVWNSGSRTMTLFLNGVLAGSRSGVSSGFAMPQGQGWLGANPQGGEPMSGTIHRLTVYAGRVSEEVILAHADAFNGIVRPPAILSLTASPETFFAPGFATLRWEVQNASAVFLDGTDVTGLSTLSVYPEATWTYTLTATNSSGSASREVTVRVNPPPIIREFAAEKVYARSGERIALRWEVEFAQALSLSPGVGDVTPQTVAGRGSIQVQPAASTEYVLTARNTFGTATASARIRLAQPASHLIISEFMANDNSTLADEDGEFSGWIEIHNPTAQAIALDGCFLTDDPQTLTRWAFPSTNLAGGAYLVVFASGQDRARAGAPLHTDFRLANSGEFLALVNPSGAVLHSFAPSFPPQRADISYGILAGDVTLTQYFGVPTPGGPNHEALPPPLPVRFSHPGGLFTNALAVTLSAPEQGVQIRYTLDGTPPGLTNGLPYSAPVQITKTARLRAVALAAGKASSISGTSFIRIAPDLAEYTSPLPLMIIENFGAGAIRQKGWNSTGAGIKQVPRQPAAWATFERIGATSGFAQAPQMLSLIGIRGRGAYSTEWRQKPYSVEAMDETGAEADVAPLGMPAHADWVLYFPDPEQSRDPALLFNTFAYELSSRMGRYAARFRWVEAFINEDGGDLSLADRRGVYALMEKVARGEDRLDFERLSPDGSTGGWLLNINRMDPEPETGWPAPNGATEPWFFHTAGPNRIVETAPNTAYRDVPGDDQPQQPNGYINFDNPGGHVISAVQRQAIESWFKRFEDVLYDDMQWRDPERGYRQYLDAQDFADYFILNVLTRNGDGLLISMFPWKGDDDKLRMGPAWDYNWSSYYVSGAATGSLMHRSDRLWYPRLFADPDFRQLYIDRWWDVRRGPASNAAIQAIIDSQAAEITPAKSLLNGMPSTAEWTRRLNQMKTWLTQRANWIDGNYLRPPGFNQDGGQVPDGFTVALSSPGATVYLTTDGTDPRAPGGSIAGSARIYSAPFAIHSPTWVKARVKNGANWSGLSAAHFSTLPNPECTAAGAPVIVAHPVSQTVVAGSSIALSVEVTNTAVLPVTFRWQRNGQDIPGGTFLLESPVCFLTLTGIQPPAASYQVRVSNAACPAGTLSALATLDLAPDADGDGQADAWELVHGLSSADPADSLLDSDGDGLSNGQEFVAGTHPRQAASCFGIAAVTPLDRGGVSLQFQLPAQRTCAVEYADALPGAVWSRLGDMAAAPLDRQVTVQDPDFRPNRFYRLVTPRPP